MRKLFILFAAAMMAVGVMAQSNVTRFADVPVDGTIENMIQKLKAKGYSYNSTTKNFTGEFFGTKTTINIGANSHNKVWRVAMTDKEYCTADEVRVRYNNIMRKFLNNANYQAIGRTRLIPDKEDIFWSMGENGKNYTAVFVQKSADGKFHQTNQVWFSIYEFFGNFYMVFFYDNLKNKE